MKQKAEVGDVFYNSKEGHRSINRHKNDVLSEDRHAKHHKPKKEETSDAFYKCTYCGQWYTLDMCCDCQEEQE